MWLGAFVERETGLVEEPERRGNFHIWDGECHVHAGIKPLDIVRTREEHPDAEFLIHPECGCSTQAMEYVAAGDIAPEGVHMLSTSGMQKHVEAHPDGEFIVATETGMLYPLQQAAPRANLIEANRMASCKYMKMITLPKLRDCLRDMSGEVSVPSRDRRAGADPDRAHGRDRVTELFICLLAGFSVPLPNRGQAVLVPPEKEARDEQQESPGGRQPDRRFTRPDRGAVSARRRGADRLHAAGAGGSARARLGGRHESRLVGGGAPRGPRRRPNSPLRSRGSRR